MSETKRTWDPWKIFDKSPEEMRAIKERAKMREALKAEWLKKYTNPFKAESGFLFDPAIQRFMALKATQYEYFRGSFRSMVSAFVLLIVPIGLLTYVTLKKKRAEEKRYRNGEVMYKDRKDKFLY